MDGLLKWTGTVLAAAAAGYLVSYLLDHFVLRHVIKDRFSSILASCTLVFIALMLGMTFYLTSTSPFEDGPVIIPPLTTALGLLLAVTFVGVVRIKRYSDAYVYNDDQAVFDPDLDDLSRYDEEVNAWDEKNGGRNYFHRHWAGHLPLPLSYWVNGALLSGMIVVIGEAVARQIEDGGGSLRLLSAVALVFLLLSLLAWIWSAVGIWRSAYWHRRRGGSAFVGTGARVLVVLGAVGIIAGTGNLTLQARELGNLALGNDPIGSVADMTVSADGRQLVLRGPIAQGAAERFSALLVASPKIETVVLTSEGGRMLEAERMARQIRGRNLDTRVDGHCMSACIHLLVAGADRTAPNRARIGFHQPSFPECLPPTWPERPSACGSSMSRRGSIPISHGERFRRLPKACGSPRPMNWSRPMSLRAPTWSSGHRGNRSAARKELPRMTRASATAA